MTVPVGCLCFLFATELHPGLDSNDTHDIYYDFLLFMYGLQVF